MDQAFASPVTAHALGGLHIATTTVPTKKIITRVKRSGIKTTSKLGFGGELTTQICTPWMQMEGKTGTEAWENP